MYFQKKRCVAMLLAGGQGSRLKVLTENTAKPAVPFGGKYRIIDFPLSNCVNSHIDTVGVLTQYQPLELNEYIGNGQPWDLNSSHGGVTVLPPYARSEKSDWYKGTANAIYQNIPFIARYDPDYVLILSGDHIYEMDYAAMLRAHEKTGADCTIAVRPVPMEEASRFGIMNTNPDGSIFEFEEKPKQPKSNKASMGIYIFNWSILRKFLEEDEADPNSDNDFGKNIIPNLLNSGHKLFAYNFSGYWKDVGTINSLWEANMDLLGDEPEFNIYGSKGRKIYARNYAMPSAFIAKGSEIADSFVAEGCEVWGTVKHSVVSAGCVIGKGAEISDSVIMPGVVVEPGAQIHHSIVAEDCVIKAGAKVGAHQQCDSLEQLQISVIGKGKTIAEGAVVAPGEII